MEIYNKLIRDHIPQIIQKDGMTSKTRILEEDEYQLELGKKLVEEAKEVQEVLGNKEELIKELADVSEVFDSMIKAFDLSKEEIENVRISRKEARGGFEKRIFLESMF